LLATLTLVSGCLKQLQMLPLRSLPTPAHTPCPTHTLTPPALVKYTFSVPLQLQPWYTKVWGACVGCLLLFQS